MKKVKNLMIVAHPDDELVFGGAELIKYGTLYKVVCISYKNNKIRSKEFENVMTQLNVSSYEMWDFKDSLQDYIHTLDENISYEQKVFKNLLKKKKLVKMKINYLKKIFKKLQMITFPIQIKFHKRKKKKFFKYEQS